jgi:tRNA U54 and U55 pseudouridine synthase Pus10
MFRSHFRTPVEGLIIEIRPRCAKCKKEFILNLKNYLPGKFHSCYGCGTVIQYNDEVAEKVQRLLKEIEVSIQEVFEDVQRLR